MQTVLFPLPVPPGFSDFAKSRKIKNLPQLRFATFSYYRNISAKKPQSHLHGISAFFAIASSFLFRHNVHSGHDFGANNI